MKTEDSETGFICFLFTSLLQARVLIRRPRGPAGGPLPGPDGAGRPWISLWFEAGSWELAWIHSSFGPIAQLRNGESGEIRWWSGALFDRRST